MDSDALHDDSIIPEVNGEQEQFRLISAMDSDASHESLASEENGATGKNLDTSAANTGLEDLSPNGEARHELWKAHELLNRLEIDVASTSEKLMNLSMLVIDISSKEHDFGPFAADNEDMSIDTVEMALEFDLLSGIFDSEVKNMDDFMASVQSEIFGAREIMHSCRHLGENLSALEKKLHDSEESVKQSLESLTEMKRQSANFQRLITNLGTKEYHEEELHASEGGDLFSANSKITMQTSEQQRHILQMLEKSLARELELEKKLAESKQTEEALKLRLHYSSLEVLSAEELVTVTFQRFLEADNTAGVMTGVLKDLMCLVHSDAMELKDEVAAAEKRAETAEARCKSLEESNSKLNLELRDKASATEKADSLERKLHEAAVRVQHTAAALDASQEKQIMLSTTINDMENVIENLKSKVSKTEDRADNAEEQCIILSEINEELHKEVDHLRGRLENLEASRQRTEEAKAATAKDIGLRTKMIADLVLQLGMERERLRNQLYSLVKENRFLIEKLRENDKQIPPEKSHVGLNEEEVVQAEEQFLATKERSSMKGEPLEDETNYEPADTKVNLESERTIDVLRLGSNLVLLVISGLMVGILAKCFVSM